MKILYLAHRIPYPPNKGDKIRSFHEIKYLAARHTIDLICLADDPEDLQHEKALQKYCRKVCVYPISTGWSKIRGLFGFCFGKSISVAYFYRKFVQETFNQWSESFNYDVIICFSSSMAEYVFRSNLIEKEGQGRASKKPKLIMDFCDVDSDKWHQYSQESSFPLKQVYHLERQRLQSYEKTVYRTFDSSIVASEQEKILFLKICPEAEDMTVIPNGVDTNYYNPEAISDLPEQTGGPVLVFTGAMDYHANVDGVSWFCREIFPLLKTELPDPQFYIVGRNPGSPVKRLETLQGVHVIGNVEDIRPWYLKADVYVVPLRLARGVQNKVLEAMAMGRAIVTTSKANAGIQAVHEKDIVIADSPEGFATAISSLYKNIEKRKHLEENARKFVAENYDWKKNMKIFDNLLI
jgi:sugar transferase (PEP-CTERM/EpsH1 system associated)